MTTPGREPMHAFSVWRGTESNTDEIRALLQAGVWPGPSSLPSPERMITEQLPHTVYAASLWGDGCDEVSPWEPMWRERHVRHGYYLVAASPSGRTVVALLSRRPASPAFSRSDVAQGEAVARFIANAADRTGVLGGTLLAAEVPVSFDGDGKLASVGMGGPELLRDLGGGRDGAHAEGRRRVETAVARYVDAVLAHPSATVAKDSIVAGPPEDSAFKRSHFALMFDGRARVPRVEHVADTPFGNFELQLSASHDTLDGRLLILGSLRCRISRELAVVRALVATDAPGREIELALQLCTDRTFAEVAQSLRIAPATAKTLLTRLGQRFAVSGRDRLLEAMINAGCAVVR